MASRLEELKTAVRKALPDLDVVIAWAAGPNSLEHTPLFITSEAEIDLMTWDPRCSQNLAGYLPGLRGKKVGIVAKGCDARSITELLQEKLIDRGQLTIFGLHCQGAADPEKIRAVAGCGNEVESAEIADGKLTIVSRKGTCAIGLENGLLAKCFRCTGADAQPCDQFIGEHGAPPALTDAPETALDRLEAMGMEERFRFWEEQMSQCIRCYACRSACPLCVCQDHCAAQSREPHWVDQTDHPREKLMFQAMHALHTAGRCTECGECERACPVGLPIMTMKLALNRQIKTLFDYEAGIDPEKTPPLFQFRETEEHIKERKW